MTTTERAPVPFAASVAAAFALLAAVGLAHHEMWRDELEIWLIARDSPSLRDLFVHMGTQGHPALWYVLNWIAARATRAPQAMQVLNGIIGTGTALLVCLYAPFSRLQRVLFCLGYFALYEFTVISRSYGLMLLLLFATLALLARRPRLGAAAAATLFLLANTHLYGTIVVSCLLLFVVLQRLGGTRPGATALAASPAAFGAVLAGVALGFGHTLVQGLRIGPDHLAAYRPGYDLPWVLDCLSTVTYGFLPLPDPWIPHTWNSSLLQVLPQGAGRWVGALLGLALLAAAAVSLRRRRWLPLVFLLGAAIELSITFFVWYGWMRHHGQIFLWYVACLWLASIGAPARPGARRLPGTVLLTAVLVVQVVAGAFAYVEDLRYPFSNAEATGRYLRRPELRDAVLVGSVDYAVEPITAFLDRPIFYPESGRFGTFMDWSPIRHRVPLERVLADAAELLDREGGEVVVVLSYPLTGWKPGDVASLGDGVRMRYFARFEGALVPDENYHLFHVFDARAGGRGVDSPRGSDDNGSAFDPEG